MRATRSAYSINEHRTQEIPCDIIVREARVQEYGAVGGVLLRSYQEFERDLPPEVLIEYLTDLVDVRLRAAVGEVLVAERQGEIVGTATFYPSAAHMGTGFPARWAGVRALAVDPAARRLGVGQQLVFDCMARTRGMGVQVLALHTGQFMTGAVAMYHKLGFRRLVSYDIDAPVRSGLQRHLPVRALALFREMP
jgi:GNAT superfamily N-acetyltransferase